MTTNPAPPSQQLRMVWPKERLQQPPPVNVAPGYILRTYRPGDEAAFFQVMGLAGFERWDMSTLLPWLSRILPNGWFLAVHEATGQIVATTMATHNPSELHPFGGELGWVAGHPDHAGKGLGAAVCAAVTQRFLQGGYFNIFLRTDDWRLPAVKTYLKLGYEPLLFAPDMRKRWEQVCAQLEWPFTPEKWAIL